jgi:hypothetical protein
VLYEGDSSHDDFESFYFSPNESASYMSANDFVKAVNRDE